ncbi:MAG: HAD-IA family hydrolase [Cyanobacteria bacterium SZAS-4]|nr:HAD-IA family hydrolase [Cyanobacteria bacterium SZAS-4]
MCIDLDNASWSRPIEPMVDWAHRLRQNGTKIAILSNMPQDFRDHLPNCTWLPQFDHGTYSCELKSVKPSHDVYHHCHGGLVGVQAEHILFIDDRQVNIDAARELGWQGHLFTDANNLHEHIKTTNLVPVFLK